MWPEKEGDGQHPEECREKHADTRRGTDREGWRQREKTKQWVQKETLRQSHGTDRQTAVGIRRQRDPWTKPKADMGTERDTDTPDTQTDADMETRTR